MTINLPEKVIINNSLRPHFGYCAMFGAVLC